MQRKVEGQRDGTGAPIYGTHPDYLALVEPATAERRRVVSEQLQLAFEAASLHDFIEFAPYNIERLSRVLLNHPLLLKPISLLLQCSDPRN